MNDQDDQFENFSSAISNNDRSNEPLIKTSPNNQTINNDQVVQLELSDSQNALAILRSRTQVGINAISVDVEVHLANGLPSFNVVGMPETAVKESKDRVRGALINSGFDFPAKRITVNLAPADVPKSGGRFDLPIALGILIASNQLTIHSIEEYEFLGELALSGEIKNITACLPSAVACGQAGKTLITSSFSSQLAVLVDGLKVLAPRTLVQIASHFKNERPLPYETNKPCNDNNFLQYYGCLSEVKGQQHAKKALEIAAAGGHHLLLFGAPGTGKTMLASRLPSILPELSNNQAIESAIVQSVSHQKFDSTKWKKRPYRSPHHSASAVALIGGGSLPSPGEVSLAHNGVLFLDELPEFSRHALEQLREPLEQGHINIARANLSVSFPADFQLIAGMNVCPCGWSGDPSGKCNCSATRIESYRNKISGPLLDRIDMHVALPRVSLLEIHSQKNETAETSEIIKKRVQAAQTIQYDRQGYLNKDINIAHIQLAKIKSEANQLLLNAGDKLNFSNRSYIKMLRVARTIADLKNIEYVDKSDISEALSYRELR